MGENSHWDYFNSLIFKFKSGKMLFSGQADPGFGT